jgi:hypothetical protein
MGQTHAESTPHLAARVCWQVARRDDTRGARRLYRTPPGEGVSRLDAGAGWEEGCHGLPRRGVLVLLAQGPGAAIPRALVPAVPEGVRAGLQTWCGITRRQARPPWWGSDAAVRPWVDGKAPPGAPGPSSACRGTGGRWPRESRGACGRGRKPGAVARRSWGGRLAPRWRPRHTRVTVGT